MLLPIALAAVFVSFGVEARIPRSSAVVAEFKRLNPCPLNDASRGHCPCYQVGHITPLCAGGADKVDNLQWLTVQEHRGKTRFDELICRTRRGREFQTTAI